MFLISVSVAWSNWEYKYIVSLPKNLVRSSRKFASLVRNTVFRQRTSYNDPGWSSTQILWSQDHRADYQAIAVSLDTILALCAGLYLLNFYWENGARDKVLLLTNKVDISSVEVLFHARRSFFSSFNWLTMYIRFATMHSTSVTSMSSTLIQKKEKKVTQLEASEKGERQGGHMRTGQALRLALGNDRGHSTYE